MTTVSPIPTGFHSLTPYLLVHDAAAAIDFYKRAFGAKEIGRMSTPEGRIMHATIQIGDSMLMLSDESREHGRLAPTSLGGSPVGIHLYVSNADETFEQAVLAGATIQMPVQEMFWGDRFGKLGDPFGHDWSIATCVRQVNPEEMKEAAKQAMCSAPQ